MADGLEVSQLSWKTAKEFKLAQLRQKIPSQFFDLSRSALLAIVDQHFIKGIYEYQVCELFSNCSILEFFEWFSF